MLIETGAPGWLYLVVLVCLWTALKMLCGRAGQPGSVGTCALDRTEDAPTPGLRCSQDDHCRFRTSLDGFNLYVSNHPGVDKSYAYRLAVHAHPASDGSHGHALP